MLARADAAANAREVELPAARKRHRRSATSRRPAVGLAFVAPTAAVVAALFLVPLGILIYMSFTDWPLLGSPTFDGFKNYLEITRALVRGRPGRLYHHHLGGLRQLPGLAVQRLIADGYGFAGEGDWKTSVLVRIFKAMSAGIDRRTSFMEDYNYELTPGREKTLGAHMLEVCPSIAADTPSCQFLR